MNKYTYSHFVKILYGGADTGLSVYTNPAIESLTLDISSEDNDLVNIAVEDSSGKEIKMDKIFVKKGKNSLSVDVKNLSKGMFAIHIAHLPSEITAQAV